jgi:acyl carrier protein
MPGQCLVFRPSDVARSKGLARILAEVAGLDEGEVELSAESFSELGLDSTQWVEFVMALEDME